MIKYFFKLSFLNLCAINYAVAGIFGGPEQKFAEGLMSKKSVQSIVQKKLSIDDAAKCSAVVIKIAHSQTIGTIPDNQDINLTWALIAASSIYYFRWHVTNGMPKSVYENLLKSYSQQLEQSNKFDQIFINYCSEKANIIMAESVK